MNHPAFDWLETLELTEENKYYSIEISSRGLSRKGFGKISDDKQFMTTLFHEHKNKWMISKEVISPFLFYQSKIIQKTVFDTVINQNLANL